MANQMIIPAMVEGGKASAGPPLGPALGPAGVNIGQVIAQINEKTKAFSGMSVPVKVIVDTKAKTFEIEVGTPPTSALIKKELGLKEPVKETEGEKGKKTIGNITLKQLLNVAAAKKDQSLAKSLKARILEATGTCLSLGATVEGKNAKEFTADVKTGKYDGQLQGD
ncbi:50S ribosomal protein L11 [Candidatus Micrarchaeota archaeon]|nr:50S ribosomal protein L11 [Candidatus Micrarchaeota archaeon]